MVDLKSNLLCLRYKKSLNCIWNLRSVIFNENQPNELRWKFHFKVKIYLCDRKLSSPRIVLLQTQKSNFYGFFWSKTTAVVSNIPLFLSSALFFFLLFFPSHSISLACWWELGFDGMRTRGFRRAKRSASFFSAQRATSLFTSNCCESRGEQAGMGNEIALHHRPATNLCLPLTNRK